MTCSHSQLIDSKLFGVADTSLLLCFILFYDCFVAVYDGDTNCFMYLNQCHSLRQRDIKLIEIIVEKTKETENSTLKFSSSFLPSLGSRYSCWIFLFLFLGIEKRGDNEEYEITPFRYRCTCLFVYGIEFPIVAQRSCWRYCTLWNEHARGDAFHLT